ncbi:MAG TPA: hypothetical protein VF590_26175, partial [Isosphaeraceae bacterium]
MIARSPSSRAARRGVVLILILGMLGLLALIGVAFATFSGQAQVGARLYSQKLYEPRVQDLMEFALGQLINDTDNPVSALRGHGILRDMYGNDAISNGALDRTLNPSTGQVVALTIVSAATGSIPGTAQVETNIIQSATYDAGAFARWILRTQTPPSGGTAPVAQTVEILDDTIGASSMSGFPPVHFLTVTAPDTTTTYSYGAISPTAVLSNLLQNQSFVLDGRYQRAFNGPGMAAAYAGLPAPASVFGNFRINGGILAGNSSVAYPGNPNAAGMDEDYDAPDLENWFLALQSADGQVVIPSFHRPGILQYQTDPMTGQVVLNDWAINQGIGSPRILRPHAADHPQSGSFQNSTTGIYTGGAFPDLVPDTNGTAATNPNYGKITYDVDNDGDGTKEAVWLDLGHPIMRDASGRMFKPLFAFTVVGLNGRLPLNTAGNLQKRGIPIPANDTFPVPLFDHASHLGYSPNEVNPEYAFAASASSNPVSALQRLLTGLRQPSSGAAIPGRWGEPELIPAAASLTFGSGVLNNPVRAGRSYPFVDGIDADYDGLDFVPLHAPTAMPPTFPEQSDFPDSAGAMLLASERIRRFVTPIDPTGNGRVLPYDTLPGGPFDFGNGFDKRGRSGFFEYFRPPGLPQNLASLGTPVVPDLSTNPYHGYESFRNPLGSPIDDPLDMTRKRPTTNAEYLAAMPWNVSGTTAPTYNGNINSSNPTPRPAPMPGTPYPALTDYGLYPGYPYPPTSSSVVFPGGTLALNEADQMNLYRPEIYDAPFGVPDLEWLYRKHDIDGASLSSRLPALVPEVFDPRFNTTDALLRSRLFSHESWETTNFVWSNDNP